MSIAAALLASCAAYDPYYSDSAYYDPYYAAYEAAYAYGTVDPYGIYYDSERSPQSVDLDAAAAAIAARAGEAFTRSECVKATSSGASVVFEHDDCEARLGGKNIYGRVGVALSQEGEQLRFAVTSSNLKIDGDAFSLEFTGAVTANGAQLVVTIDSRSRATEKVDSRTSTGTITWEQGNPCVTIDAQSSSTKDEVAVTSTLAGFQRCADACPAAGEVIVRGGEGLFSGSFDGSDKLRVNAPNGSERNYGLQCR